MKDVSIREYEVCWEKGEGGAGSRCGENCVLSVRALLSAERL